jgi:DNA-binding protein HU-beta
MLSRRKRSPIFACTSADREVSVSGSWDNQKHTTGDDSMNKAELIDKVAAAAELNKASATRAVEAVLDGISASLQGGEQVTLSGFGTFSVTTRAARTGRNPRTGESIAIPASKNPKFKAGKGLKDAVN